MDLGVLEGQTRGDYFLNSIFDHSVNQCTADPSQGTNTGAGGWPGFVGQGGKGGTGKFSEG